MTGLKPRMWQEKALQKFNLHDGLCFLIDATPGAGKTYFSAFCTKSLMTSYRDLFTVIVVPTTALKDSFLNSYHAAGINLTTVLKDGRGRPTDFQGAVVTYQQLPNLISSFEQWVRNGQKMMFVFDEVHHASEENVWGSAAESCGRMAVKILAMTGTPFRGDGKRISFINYNDQGMAASNASYTYREAVAMRDCREVVFLHDDGVAEYYRNEIDMQNDTVTKQKISEAKNGAAYEVSKVIFRKDSEWLNTVLVKADKKLEQYRAEALNAGGIVICRPGYDENDDRHLKPIANMIEEMTGERPVVITHEDKDANAKIEQFRNSKSKWIIAVRKISEGVDIKRLRVMVVLSCPSTELLFRQLVGRVVRVEDKEKHENATVFIAKFPSLMEWASRIMEEAKQGIKDREEMGEGNGNGTNGNSFFHAKGCSHEHGGGTSIFGEHYNPYEINFAESIKENDPLLASVSIIQIAHLCKKMNVTPPNQEQPTKPLHEIKVEKRTKVNRLAREYAIKTAPTGDKPDFAGIWKKISSAIGVKNLDDLTDNHPIEKMDMAIRLLEKAIASLGCGDE